MGIGTFNSYLIIQRGGQTGTRGAHAAPTAQTAPSADPQVVTEDQMGELVRSRIAAALRQERGAPVVAPAPPPSPREFVITGRHGERTVIGMPNSNDIIPPQAVDISLAFFFTVAAIIIGLPIARAFARRMDRKGGTAQIPSEVSAHLAHLNQAVDAIAVEVERISEGQRFTTRLLSEQRDAAHQTLPSGSGR